MTRSIEQVSRRERSALDDVRRTWERLGGSNPLWAVRTDRDPRAGWDHAEFFASGESLVRHVLDVYAERGVRLRCERALDFGCGVGRLSQALAARFATVDGVDVSVTMLAEAQSLNRHGDRCRYHVNTAPDLALFPDATFDFVLSSITLQHMPPPLALRYLGELARVAAPGAGLVVDIALPSWRSGVRRSVPPPLWRAYRWLASHRQPRMQMYGIARAGVLATLHEHGVTVVHEEWMRIAPAGGYRYYCVLPSA